MPVPTDPPPKFKSRLSPLITPKGVSTRALLVVVPFVFDLNALLLGDRLRGIVYDVIVGFPLELFVLGDDCC